MSENSFYYISKHGKLNAVPTVNEALDKAKAGGFVWLSYCLPTIEELSVLVEPLGLHPLSLEDCVDDNQLPKIEDFTNHTFILFNAFSYAENKLNIEEINLFIGANFLVTVHRGGQNGLLNRERLEQIATKSMENAKHGPAFLMHLVLDYIVDQKFGAIETLGDELEKIEDSILDRLSSYDAAELQRIRRDMLALRKSLFHEREILVKICRKDCRYIPEPALFHYRDVYDHITKFFELAETHREVITNLIEMNFSIINHRMAVAANRTNSSVRRLTLITTIFMPLSLLAGIGGMSEWSMMTGPGNWKIAYPAFLLGLAVIGIASHFLLKQFEKKDGDL